MIVDHKPVTNHAPIKFAIRNPMPCSFRRQTRRKEQGLIKPDSPVGVWELTEEGHEEAAKLAGQ